VTRKQKDATILSDQDLFLFNEGSHLRLWEKLGSHPAVVDGEAGTRFAVWAPNAESVAVMGDWNGWSKASAPLAPVGASGIWQGFVPGVERGAVYKYHLRSRHGGYSVDKADPFAIRAELPPRTGSVVWSLDHRWGDREWMESRADRSRLSAPISIYELHVGSWRRVPGEGNRSLSYRELAEQLPDYVAEQGFTHVELMPVMEHPFFGSWGYQTTGYFAASRRYGSPQDLMALVDALHRREIGVILDWVPSHFPTDEHGLGFFDGTHLFEHGDPREGFHPDWGSFIFNYGRHEVRSFLLSSACFWLEAFHADGLRVDAVASMLYRDYSRKRGEWIPNEYGGRENLEAMAFLRRMNEDVYKAYPGVQTIAEESTAWPMVSRPTYVGGLGFGLKWDMGWMHDTLEYMRHDPIHRSHHHGALTFRMIYAFNENFVLPLSHDEVVHGKGSLLGKMPGDEWQKLANLRLLYGAMWMLPGKKMLFMGGEFGQRSEWNHDQSLDWHLLDADPHRGLQRWVRDLNTTYRAEPALHALDCEPEGFRWIDCNDAQYSTLSWLRSSQDPGETVMVACNFTPIPRYNHRIGAPQRGDWREILNSDASLYGGSSQGNLGGAETTPVACNGHPQSLTITLPPLGIVAFKAGGS
jgi:1,4-alpha-glucan branching enzyme